MLEFPVWKRTLVLLFCLGGVLLAFPNLLGEEARQRLPSWLPRDAVNLGLDLQGGAHFLVEVRIEDVYRERMESYVARARSALREGGVRRFTGLRAGEDSASVTVTNAEDVDAAGRILRDLATPIAETLFNAAGFDIEVTEGENRIFTMQLTPAAKAQISRSTLEQSLEVIRRRVDELGTREPTIQAQGERRILVQLPGASSVNPDIIGKTAKLTFHLVDESVTRAALESGRAGPGRIVLPDSSFPGLRYALERRALVTGEQLEDAQPGFDGRTGEPVVTFRFNATGGKRFADATQANVGRPFAIVLDDEVVSAPVIQEPILGGSGQISGNFSVVETQELSAILRAGALPATITIEEASQVGPELGADSVLAGAIACIVALCAVLIFMAAVYGLFGFFADVALVLNVILILGVLSMIGAALTLPGIAGIVLTVGMAVDANVLVFERIREELRSGRKPLQAIETGYQRALTAIIDANVTTFIAAAILFAMGSGPVKGFAVTLGIGVVSSVFTAFMVTRFLVAVWFGARRPRALEL